MKFALGNARARSTASASWGWKTHASRDRSSAISRARPARKSGRCIRCGPVATALDRKSTRLNSSHSQISYAAFCLKKKTRSALGHMRVLGAPDDGGEGPVDVVEEAGS